MKCDFAGGRNMRLRHTSLLCCVGLVFAHSSYAQSGWAGSILGIVPDSTGIIVAGANVTEARALSAEVFVPDLFAMVDPLPAVKARADKSTSTGQADSSTTRTATRSQGRRRGHAHSQEKPSLEQPSLSQSLPGADGPGLSV